MNAGQLNIDLRLPQFPRTTKSSDKLLQPRISTVPSLPSMMTDPDHLMTTSPTSTLRFQPSELSNVEPVNNAKLEKQAVKAGVSEDVAAAAFSGKNEYLDWLTAPPTNLHDPARTVQQLQRLLLPTHHQRRILGSEAAHAGGHEYGGRLPQVHWAGCLARSRRGRQNAIHRCQRKADFGRLLMLRGRIS